MNGKILLDTNIIIYSLQGDEQITRLLDGEKLSISFITEIELLSLPQLNQQDIRLIQDFINSCKLIDYSSGLKDKVIEIRKKYGLKMSDAFVAASNFG